jgi:ankyrin repeat protein
MPKGTRAPRPDFEEAARITDSIERNNFIRAAGSKYDPSVVEAYLEKYGPEAIDTKDEMGWTALIAAARWGQLDMVRFLIGKGADVNVLSNVGWGALHCAALHGYTEIVSELIVHGANVNVYDQDGKNPLMFAAEKGFTDTLSLLIANDADINAQSPAGNTPLIFAVQNKQIACVKTLLENGASTEIMNSKHQTARIIALSLKREEIVEMIEVEEESRRRAEIERKINSIDLSKGLSKPMPIPASPFAKNR